MYTCASFDQGFKGENLNLTLFLLNNSINPKLFSLDFQRGSFLIDSALLQKKTKTNFRPGFHMTLIVAEFYCHWSFMMETRLYLCKSLTCSQVDFFILVFTKLLRKEKIIIIRHTNILRIFISVAVCVVNHVRLNYFFQINFVFNYASDNYCNHYASNSMSKKTQTVCSSNF